MSTIVVQQMAERVADLMESRLQIQGKGLAAKLQNGSGGLPADLRESAEFLVAAAGMVKDPRKEAEIDEAKAAEAYNDCVRHLTAIGGRARRSKTTRRFGASAAFGLLVALALLLALLAWRGFL